MKMRLAKLVLTAMVAFWGIAAAQNAAPDTQQFSDDPRWEGFRNRLVPEPAPVTEQNFGYSPDTNHVGGTKGEIGGRVQRSTAPAWYAMKIPTKTLDQKLKASGKFAVTEAAAGSGTLFGWFNDTSRGWRTPNALVMRIDGNGGNYWMFFEYGTRHWLTGGAGCFEGRYQTTSTPPFQADGTVHEWVLEYDPAGNNGSGVVTFTIDGKPYTLDVPPENRADGAGFNRFGVLNQMTTGAHMQAWFDDLVVDGEKIDLNRDPGWEQRGNRGSFEDRVLRPLHDFGYSPDTNFAGGKNKGEVGGIIWRDEAPAYYGAKTRKLTLDDKLSASGRIAFTAAGSDSGVYFGWFNSQSKQNQDKPQHEIPLKNLLGVGIEGPSRVGHYFRPAYSDSRGEGEAPEGPLIRPDAQVHTWSFSYDPDAADGNGQIVCTFDGAEQRLNLKPDVRKSGATFDRFGIFNMQSGGHHVEIYLDDLVYTGQ